MALTHLSSGDSLIPILKAECMLKTAVATSRKSCQATVKVVICTMEQMAPIIESPPCTHWFEIP